MQIFLNSLKNFAKSLKYIFTPIGVIAVCFIIGMTIAFNNIYASVNGLISGVQSLVSETQQVDFFRIITEIGTVLNQEDTSDINAFLSKVLTQDYLVPLFRNVIQKCYPTVDVNIQAVTDLIHNVISTILIGAVIVILFIFIGLFASYLITRFFLVRDIRRRRFWQAIIFTIVNGLITAGFAFLSARCVDLGWWGIPLGLLILLANNTVSLFIAWLIQGYKKIPLKQILSVKNVVFLFLANLIIFATSLTTIILLFYIPVPVLVMLLVVAIIDIAVVAMSVNAEGYVYYLVNNDKKIAKAKEKSK